MAKRYRCKCGYDTSDKEDYLTHVRSASKLDGKGIHGKAGRVKKNETVELSEAARVRSEIEAEYEARLAQAMSIMKGQPEPVKPEPLPSDAEVALFYNSVANLKVAEDQKCIVFRQRYCGGWRYEALDTTKLDTSNCMWYRYGVHYPVFYEKENGNGKVLIPVEDFDLIGELPSMLFDAQNSASYKKVLKPKMGGLVKLRMGVMVVLVLGIFLLVYVMSSGQGGA